MYNEVQHAIDTGLNGLYVTERDVQAILRRVRAQEAPRKPRTQPRFAVVIAAALVMVVAGAAFTLVNRIGGNRNNDPLVGNPTPTEVSGIEVAAITPEEAIALAENHVLTKCDSYAALRDETLYRIACDYHPADAHCGAGHYRVTFAALDLYGTEYTVDVLSAPGSAEPIVNVMRQRGVGEGHTAQEMRAGYARMNGDDMQAWSPETLNAYVSSLRRADPTSMAWEDTLMLEVTYLDPAEAAWTPGEGPVTAKAERWAPTSAKLVRYKDQTSWLHFLPEPLTEGEGIHWAVVSEWSVEAQTFLCSRRYDAKSTLGLRALIPNAAYADNMQVGEDWGYPTFTQEQGVALAAAHILAEYGVDVTDPAKYTNQLGNELYYITRDDLLEVRCVPKNAGDPTYWVRLNFHGLAQDSGMYVTGNELDALRRTVLGNDATYTEASLVKLQENIRLQGDLNDPIAKAIASTEYVEAYLDDNGTRAIREALGVRRMSYKGPGLGIRKDGRVILKGCCDTELGTFLVEYDTVSQQITSAVEIPAEGAVWYASCLLQADMEAAGIAPAPYQHPENDGDPTVDIPVPPMRGFRLDYLNDAFFLMYGPDMLQWSQEQLRTYQQYAILAEGMTGDMGIFCLRNTTYPDVPLTAISREEAGERAIKEVPGTEFAGAVLIGTPSDDPVWKVGLRGADGAFWLAEVACFTGQVKEVYAWSEVMAIEFPVYDEGQTPEYWYREIVLEDTIRECEEAWQRKSNG